MSRMTKLKTPLKTVSLPRQQWRTRVILFYAFACKQLPWKKKNTATLRRALMHLCDTTSSSPSGHRKPVAYRCHSSIPIAMIRQSDTPRTTQSLVSTPDPRRLVLLGIGSLISLHCEKICTRQSRERACECLQNGFGFRVLGLRFRVHER